MFGFGYKSGRSFNLTLMRKSISKMVEIEYIAAIR